MASIDARVKKLETKVEKLEKELAKQKKEIATLKKCCTQVEKWVKLEVAWSTEVTNMLHQIDWARLAQDYGGGLGGNPPQTPPDWPLI